MVARKISKAEQKRLSGEDDTRILTKKRAAPTYEKVEEKRDHIIMSQAPDFTNAAPVKEAPMKHEMPMGLSAEKIQPLVDAILQSNQQVADALHDLRKNSEKTRPLIDAIHIGNIERNGQNRISGADMNVTYRGDK